MTRQELKQKAINNLRFAIRELEEAIRFIRNNKFESAENEIADALKFEANAIRRINEAEIK